MNSDEDHDHCERSEAVKRFGMLLTDAQPQLFAFAVTLVSDLDLASDIVQEANLELWERSSRFDHSRQFLPWACGVVRYRVLSHIRDSQREKVRFGSELVEQIATELVGHGLRQQDRQAAFNSCFKQLTDYERKLIEMRYSPQGSVAKMSHNLQRSPASISSALTKIRRKLTVCTQRKLVAEDHQ